MEERNWSLDDSNKEMRNTGNGNGRRSDKDTRRNGVMELFKNRIFFFKTTAVLELLRTQG